MDLIPQIPMLRTDVYIYISVEERQHTLKKKGLIWNDSQVKDVLQLVGSL